MSFLQVLESHWILADEKAREKICIETTLFFYINRQAHITMLPVRVLQILRKWSQSKFLIFVSQFC